MNMCVPRYNISTTSRHSWVNTFRPGASKECPGSNWRCLHQIMNSTKRLDVVLLKVSRPEGKTVSCHVKLITFSSILYRFVNKRYPVIPANRKVLGTSLRKILHLYKVKPSIRKYLEVPPVFNHSWSSSNASSGAVRSSSALSNSRQNGEASELKFTVLFPSTSLVYKK